MANTLYRIALNLAYGEEPLQGLPYSLDKTVVAVRIPYNGYITRKVAIS